MFPMRPGLGMRGRLGARPDAYGTRIGRLGAERSQVQILSPIIADLRASAGSGRLHRGRAII